MPKPGFGYQLTHLRAQLSDLYDTGTHEEQVQCCRLLDAFLLPRVDKLHGTGAMPRREPMAVTLSTMEARAVTSTECTHCGTHHHRPMDCPQYLPSV